MPSTSNYCFCCYSVANSVSDSLLLHEQQPTSLPCPSLSPRICSKSCPLCQGCYLTISSSATFLSFCLQPFPASESVPMSELFTSGGQSIGLISFRIAWFDLLAVQGTLKSLLQHHNSEASVLWHLAFFMVQLYICT